MGDSGMPSSSDQPGYEAQWPDDAGDWAVDPTPDKHKIPTLTGPHVPELDRDEAADERGTGRAVRAEWALWGKAASEPEYHVLRCSKGTFGTGDFHGIVTRYTSGSKGSLPQYTVCWIPDEHGQGYLAVGLHELADPDPLLSGGRVRASRGREIEYVRLFCVRYSEIAKHQASYTELVESVREQQLPAGPTDPILIELRETEPLLFPTEVRALAANVATLLLTAGPVCVLGAERITPEERLHFIDTVMSLLPYGLRTTLSASTWASATAKALKLRLFFTNAKRADGDATAYVTWGQPVRLDLSGPEYMPLRHYENWLEHDGFGAAAELAEQTNPVRFTPVEIRRLVAELPRDRPVNDVLEELADGVRHGHLPVVQAAVRRLRQRLASPQSLAERTEYRRAIERLGLFHDHQKLHRNTSASVYRVLLGLAFGAQISYGSYCDIEDCAAGPPHATLGREILKLKFRTVLPWLLASKAAAGFEDQELMASLRGQGIAAATPVTELCRNADRARPAHRPVGYDFAVRYLRAYAAEPRAELVQRGYLAQTLESVFPDDQRAQRIRLEDTLWFIYGGLLSNQAVTELYSQPGVRRTAAFEAAVARLTAQRSRHSPRVVVGLRQHVRTFGKSIHGSKVVLNAAAVVIGLAVVAIAATGIIIALLLHLVHV